jgi:DNA-binding NtrC family response regulator
VEPEHLPPHVLSREADGPALRPGRSTAPPAGPLEPLHAVERQHIRRALRQAAGNKAQAARLLSLSRHQLYLRLERLGITDW